MRSSRPHSAFCTGSRSGGSSVTPYSLTLAGQDVRILKRRAPLPTPTTQVCEPSATTSLPTSRKPALPLERPFPRVHLPGLRARHVDDTSGRAVSGEGSQPHLRSTHGSQDVFPPPIPRRSPRPARRFPTTRILARPSIRISAQSPARRSSFVCIVPCRGAIHFFGEPADPGRPVRTETDAPVSANRDLFVLSCGASVPNLRPPGTVFSTNSAAQMPDANTRV